MFDEINEVIRINKQALIASGMFDPIKSTGGVHTMAGLVRAYKHTACGHTVTVHVLETYRINKATGEQEVDYTIISAEILDENGVSYNTVDFVPYGLRFHLKSVLEFIYAPKQKECFVPKVIQDIEDEQKTD